MVIDRNTLTPSAVRNVSGFKYPYSSGSHGEKACSARNRYAYAPLDISATKLAAQVSPRNVLEANDVALSGKRYANSTIAAIAVIEKASVSGLTAAPHSSTPDRNKHTMLAVKQASPKAIIQLVVDFCFRRSK